MNYNSKNPYESLIKPHIDIKKTVFTVCLVIGCILAFISLFLEFPAYLWTLIIGLILIVSYFIYTLLSKKGYSKPKVKKAKEPKIQVCKKIKEDKTKVLSTCPSCNRTIRLPNKKGKHGVTCPICKKFYEVKIK